jgi:hypothetical protein
MSPFLPLTTAVNDDRYCHHPQSPSPLPQSMMTTAKSQWLFVVDGGNNSHRFCAPSCVASAMKGD